MLKNKKSICVIGAGSSGLITIKELLDEGHEVTCFEKYDQPGGVFYHNDNDEKAGVYDSTLLTVSNYMMAFSCFPPPLEEERKFWKGREYEQYLQKFTQHFDLNKHIQYETEVISIKQSDDGTYSIEIKSTNNESNSSLFTFDAVAVCSGTHRMPKYIEIEGKDKFKGEIHHSAFYKNAKPFTGKRAVCIGLGETGADIAEEVAQVTESCILSLRHYQPVVQRFPQGGNHTNDAYTSHFLYSMPVKALNLLSIMVFLVTRLFTKKPETKAFAEWNLKTGNYFNHFFTKNEIFFNSIVQKKLTVNVSGISHLTEDSVVFNDGHKENVDMVMLNTGYVDQFPLIADVEIGDMRQLYKHMIHPDLGAGIVLIGWARPAVGGVPACAEMQSRYFALLCSGEKKLPEKEELMQLITRQANYENEVYYKNPNVRTLVHYSRYMSDFSKVIGCSPWRSSTLFNPLLAYRLWFGSQMPVIYRLHGPHSNFEQAKKTVFNVPVASNIIELAVISLYAIIMRGLAALRIIKPDPKY